MLGSGRIDCQSGVFWREYLHLILPFPSHMLGHRTRLCLEFGFFFFFFFFF